MRSLESLDMSAKSKDVSEAVTMFCHPQAETVAAAMNEVSDFGRYRGLEVVRIWAGIDVVYCWTVCRASGTSVHENRRATNRIAHWAGYEVPVEAVLVRAKVLGED